MLTISLRGKEYIAEHLTDLNYLPIGQLFVESNGQFTLSDVEDYESLQQQQKIKLTLPMMQRLSDPDAKASVAQALTAIFPSLPKDLVEYKGKGEFNLNLTLEELLKFAIAIANALSPELKNTAQENQELNEIEFLQSQLDELKASRGFAKK